MADEDGLLAIGGDFVQGKIIYKHTEAEFFHGMKTNIFYGGAPDPRFVLYPSELKISSSMKQLLKKQTFEFSVNTDFNVLT